MISLIASLGRELEKWQFLRNKSSLFLGSQTMNIINFSSNPFILLRNRLPFRTITTNPRSLRTIHARSNNSPTPATSNQQQQQQLNLSVLRFTLGIPGLDESYLPRWIGFGFGSLLILNHLLGSSSTTPAQLRSEVLGLCLAAFSIAVPYVGKFLKGATPVEQATLPEGFEQIFAMSQNLSDTLKEDLAWATYILLRNTNSVSVLISIRGALCVRGYWNTPGDVLKANVLDWFKEKMERLGLSGLKEPLYFPQSEDSEIWKILPKETRSLLVYPVVHASKADTNKVEKIEGYLLLASSTSNAFNDKDRAWIGAVANKFNRTGHWANNKVQFPDKAD